jgi:hypothetical protein
MALGERAHRECPGAASQFPRMKRILVAVKDPCDVLVIKPSRSGNRIERKPRGRRVTRANSYIPLTA